MALGRQQDFEMHSGNDRDLVVTVTDAAGAVVDISAASAIRWSVSQLDESGTIPLPKSETALLAKTLGGGITITNGPLGIFTVALPKADTESLRGSYYHEAEIVLSAKESTIMFGKLAIYRNLIQ